jgi:hypothetical protein
MDNIITTPSYVGSPSDHTYTAGQIMQPIISSLDQNAFRELPVQLPQGYGVQDAPVVTQPAQAIPTWNGAMSSQLGCNGFRVIYGQGA